MEQELTAGAVVGSYRVEAPLGRGGMGAVYLAEHVHLKRRVALKVLPPGLADDPDFRERFIRESQLAASIDHPNVMPVYDADDEDGVLYIAMRYVDGNDLKQILYRDKELGPERTLDVISQVASGLDAAHARGLVHRDVKPANVMIEAETGRVFVTDFGIAKLASMTGITRTGSFLGTIEYASPEQFEGKALDRRSDVYSLGCMLFHCLTGRPPYVRDSDVAVMHAHMIDPSPRLADVSPGLPSAVDAVVAKAMAKQPDDRYPTAGDAAIGLRDALGQAGETLPIAGPGATSTTAARPMEHAVAAAPTEAQPSPRVRRIRRRWLYAAVLALVLAGAGIAAALVATGGGGSGTAGVDDAGRLQPGKPLELDVHPTGEQTVARFSGKAGQRVMVRWTENTVDTWTNVAVVSANGNEVARTGFSGEKGALDPQTLPSGGSYQLQLEQDGTKKGSVTLALSIVPPDARGRLRPGVPLPLTITKPGQKAVASFTGKAGQRVVFSWGRNTLVGWTDTTVLSSAGVQVSASGFSGDRGISDPLTLPATDSYELQLDPVEISTGSVILTLTLVPPDAQVRLKPGGPVKVTITAIGQKALARFSGKAGQSALLNFEGNALPGWTTVTLLSSKGTTVGVSGFSGERGATDAIPLPASGLYELQLDPDGASTGSVTLTLEFNPAVG